MSEKIKYKSENTQKKSNKKQNKTRKMLNIIIALLLVILAGIIAFNVYIDSLYNVGETVPIEFITPEEVQDDVINILVCGIDYEEGRTSGLTDVLVYATLDIENNKISALQIQRDTFMGHDIPGNGKINGAYSNGDEEEEVFNTIKVINEKLHLPVDHYVTLDMDAFVSMVDGIDGGLEMYIPYPIILKGENGQDEVMFSEAGTYTINGTQAEQIVRNRNYEGSADTKRAEVQGYFYSALITYFTEDLGIDDFYNVMSRFTTHLTTDMDWTEIYSLANFAFGVPYENMTLITPTVRGALYSTSTGSISLLEVMPQEWADILNEHFVFYRETPLTAQDLTIETWQGTLIQDYGVVPTSIRTIQDMLNGTA